jgi:hypothetical protein
MMNNPAVAAGKEGYIVKKRIASFPAGDGKLVNLFLRCRTKKMTAKNLGLL